MNSHSGETTKGCQAEENVELGFQRSGLLCDDNADTLVMAKDKMIVDDCCAASDEPSNSSTQGL